MRDVQTVGFIRYVHNGASMFFHRSLRSSFSGLYYGSYMKPRQMLWCSGVVLFPFNYGYCFLLDMYYLGVK
jgi:quinol-cytochrome oxidoreductase complex cytochrome b subunit